MTEITKWVADDGEEFEDYDECREYEIGLELKAHKDAIHLWDYRKNPISLHDEGDYEKAYYLLIETEPALNALENIASEYWSVQTPGNDGFSKPGLFVWDEDDDCWMCVEQEIARLRELQERFYPMRNYVAKRDEWVF